jgi:hypothetical protein
MKKLISFRLSLLLVWVGTVCNGSTNQSNQKLPAASNKFFMVYEIGLGVVNDKQVNFYYFQQEQWMPDAKATFNIPAGADGVFSWLGGLVVIKNKQANFYQYIQHQWTLDPKSTFNIPEETDGLFSLETKVKLGVIKGKQVVFYSFNQGLWTLDDRYPASNFNIPNKSNGLFPLIAGGCLSIIKGKQVDFYNPYTGTGDVLPTFNIPEGAEGLFSWWGSIGVIKGKQVNFYGFEKGERQWVPYPQLTFNIP